MENTNTSLISEFIDESSILALEKFLNSQDDFGDAANKIAAIFGSKNPSETDDSALIASFKNNLELLIQKTWVEKSDVELKESLLYKLEKFSAENSWKKAYPIFLEIVRQAVFLMFGQPVDSLEFAEYSLRIDPEFGIFWWYISNLSPDFDWSEEKCRIAMKIGMYFLANY